MSAGDDRFDADPADDMAEVSGAGAGPIIAIEGLDAFDPAARLAAWRARAPQADAVTLSIAAGLVRRAAAQRGATRDHLLGRLEKLLPSTGPQADSPEPADAGIGRASLEVLAELVDRLGRGEPGDDEAPTAPHGHDDDGHPAHRPRPARPPSGGLAAPMASSPAARAGSRAAPRSTLARAVPPRPLKSIAGFGATWSRLRADQRLRQALSQVPDRPGPLNSANVVNRALRTMREISPAYLDAFMAHVDTLMALEQSAGMGDLLPKPAAASAAGADPAASGPKPPKPPKSASGAKPAGARPATRRRRPPV